MRRIAALILACALAFPMVSCAQKTENVPTWQEQYDLGLRYLEEGNYEEAVLAFTAAIEIDPKQAPAYIGRGDAYVRSGETEENLTAALADYKKAMALDETAAEAYLGLADVYIRQGDVDRAIELLRDGMEKTGNSQAIANKLADLEGDNPQNEAEIYPFDANITNTGLDVNGQYLTVQIRDSRSATITISGLELRDSYQTNRSDSFENAEEYMWTVFMEGTQTSYSVSTGCWAFDPGAEELRRIEEMQHSLWVANGEGGFHLIGDAAMSRTSESITWEFKIPEEYPFDFNKVDRYMVTVFDCSTGLNLVRTYEN